MIGIINYGMGNLGSMLNMFKKIGVNAQIVESSSEIGIAEKLILPGVGAFDPAMDRINGIPSLREAIEEKVFQERAPILGVCLGMQLMTSGSEEGDQLGLGWIPGKAKLFPKLDGIKVPHMGWNIANVNKPSKLTECLDDEPRYYFVHSYCVNVDDEKYSLMKTNYGINFDSAIGFENIYGVQFHPEKSHRFGMQILNNFARL